MRVNPILDREVRQRMRGPRAVFMITAYLVLLTLVMWASYAAGSNRAGGFAQQMGDPEAGFIESSTDFNSLLGVTRAGETGRLMFSWALITICLLVCLAVPTMAAASIASERERDTLIPMQVTPMSPWKIVFGKLGSVLLFVALLQVAGLPVMAVAYLVGGVTLGELLKAFVGIMILATLLAAIGVGVSSLTKRTLSAVLLTNVLIGGLLLGSLVFSGLLASSAFGGKHPLAARYPLLANPIVLIGDLVGDETATGGSKQAWDQIRSGVTGPDARLVRGESANSDEWLNVGPDGGGAAENAGDEPWRDDIWRWPLRAIPVQALIAVVFLALAARRLVTPAKKDR